MIELLDVAEASVLVSSLQSKLDTCSFGSGVMSGVKRHVHSLQYKLSLRVRAYPWILSKYFSVCLCVSFVRLQIILGTVFRLIICILFAKLHRMSYDISLTCWILCNPMVFPFMLLFYIHFILIPMYKLYTDSYVQIWILFEIILSPGYFWHVDSAFFKYFLFFLHCSLYVGEKMGWMICPCL